MRHKLLVLAAAAVLVTACVPRPRYQELLAAGQPQDGQVAVVFTDAETGEPLPNMRITFGDGPSRKTVTTDEQGVARLPRDARLEAENPVVAVDRPSGVATYRFGAPGGPQQSTGGRPTPTEEAPVAGPPTDVGQREGQLVPVDGGTTTGD